MDERRESSAVPWGIEVANEARRVRTHYGEQRLDGLEHAGNTAEGESRRTEAHDLSIVRCLEASNDVDGICCGCHMVEGQVEAVEPLGPCSFNR